MKKLLSIFMAVVILAASLNVGTSALETKSGSLNIMTYNVSGIPVFGDLQGSQREFKGNARMAKIGDILSSESGCDIIGTQEDFNLHPALAKAMLPAYSYQSLSSGGLPLGDGLGIFSKFPLYNVKHTKWNSTYGIISGSADKLAQKGILSSTIEICDGVYVDFYVIHTDAGVDSKSVAARADNFRQLAAKINSREYDRAVIIIGDYNSTYDNKLDDDMYNNLVKPAGLTDCWAEIYNHGDCSFDNGVGWNPSLYETYDKVLFKSGGGVELNAESYQYKEFTNAQGKTYTDHISTKACVSYKIVGDTTNTQTLITEAPIDANQRQLDEFKAVLNSVYLIFTHLDELTYLIRQGINLLQYGKG